MERALFAPGEGYYSSQLVTVGRHGDFSTSATASELLGQAVAAWLTSEMQAQPEVRHVIEVGGGNGALSASVRKGLGWWKRRRVQWHMVENSSVLAQQQRERLGSHAALWYEDISTALQSARGRAFIFHNELVDAFPVRVLQWNAATSAWDELWINEGSEILKPAPIGPDDLDTFTALKSWNQKSPPPHPAQRVELHTAYHGWLAQWAPQWTSGAMLTIDYGETFPKLYHRQPRGTVRAYFRHQRLTGADVYARRGKQDITTDVNFSDLTTWGDQHQWNHTPLQTQRDFITLLLPGLAKSPPTSPADAFLVDEYGAGGAFKVLVQRPGLT